jgi:rhodanese-related sulfurtransferase
MARHRTDGGWILLAVAQAGVRAARPAYKRWMDSPPAAIRRRPDTVHKTAKSMVEEATAAITTYSIEDACDLHGRDDVQFIDIRDIRELERDGVIPGAFHAPRGMLEFWACPESPYFKPVFKPGKQLVLFCAAGWRSALATKTLQDMGLPAVAHIDGGFDAWKKAGHPVAEKPKKPHRA